VHWKGPKLIAKKPNIGQCNPGTRVAVTNARFVPLHGLPVVPVPLSTTPVPLRKPRARHELACCRAARAAGFRLRLGGGVALRLHFAIRFIPSSAPLSPLADHRPKPSVRNCGRADEFVSSGASSIFLSPIEELPSHSAGWNDSATKARLIVWRRRARQGYYGSARLGAPASVPPLTRPPTPGSFASRFSSREAVAVQLRETPSAYAF